MSRRRIAVPPSRVGSRAGAVRRLVSGLAALAFAASLAAGCKIQQTGRADTLDGASSVDVESSPELRVAVAVARELRAQPDSAGAILERHRLTRAGLDSMLYRIAVDAELAARYDRAAGRRASDELE